MTVPSMPSTVFIHSFFRLATAALEPLKLVISSVVRVSLPRSMVILPIAPK